MNTIKLDEKYRPRKIVDLVGNPNVKRDLTNFVRNKNIPHLLFSGNAGTGKTSAAHAIVNELYNGVTKRKVLEINASDENGVAIIRTIVKDFAKNSGPQNKVPFRIIILDECDSMTPAAQAALRRIMELFAKHCRFILMCNYPENIIAPVKSRCTVYPFINIAPDQMIPRLSYICETENIEIEDTALEYIAKKANGDIRSAINSFLESLRMRTHKLFTIKDIRSIKIDGKTTGDILKSCLNIKFLNARSKIYKVIKHGVTLRELLQRLNKENIKYVKTPNLMKGDVSLALLEIDEQIRGGCGEDMAICSLIGKLQIIGKKYKDPKPEKKIVGKIKK